MPSTINLEKYKNVVLPTLYQSQIHVTKYSRFNNELNRRETWPETVKRYIDFMVDQADKNNYHLTDDEQIEIYESILHLKTMPSMRCMMTAGKALEVDNCAGYNCAYLPIDNIRSFDEALYILTCGTGVGFSVERQYINSLPDLPSELHEIESVIVVHDSRIGWAIALRQLISLLYEGMIPSWDLSKIRKAGAKLKVFGGRASGPKPLDRLLKYTVSIFKEAINSNQNKLSSIQCHLIMCMIADAIVSGGVRRSAMISLSNPSDERMRNAKSGTWWEINPHLRLANNSAAWTEKPNAEVFLDEWTALVKSKSGERGIFNRKAALAKAKSSRRINPDKYQYGCNPCCEIILRPRQFCNLSEVVVRADDTLTTLKEKVKIATILGTLQSTLTNFRYLSSQWKKNTEEERLLGVSLTGILDNAFLSNISSTTPNEQFENKSLKDVLTELKQLAIDTNAEWADKLGIPHAAAVTTVKPSGTVSQLVDSASGIHPRFSEYYIRTNRANKVDPIAKFMIDNNFPVEDSVYSPDTELVFSFPIKSPKGSIYFDDLSAIDHLKIWLTYQDYWCEHKPSVSIFVKDDEWMDVSAFVYDNFDRISGISFFPKSENIYQQAPYQKCSEKEYNELLSKMPTSIDWLQLSNYEQEDNTTASHEIACAGNVCEIS